MNFNNIVSYMLYCTEMNLSKPPSATKPKLRFTCFNGSKMPFKILSKLYVKKKSHVPMCKLSSYWIGCLLCIFLKILLVKNECPPPVCTKFLLVQLSYCEYSSDSYWLNMNIPLSLVYTKFLLA